MLFHTLSQFAALIDRKAAGIPSASSFSIQNVLNAVYFWAGAIAVIIVIIAGFFYVTSVNNAQQITRAKNAIISAVVGLIVILLAFTVTNIVVGGV